MARVCQLPTPDVVEGEVELEDVDAGLAEHHELSPVGVLRRRAARRLPTSSRRALATRSTCSRALAIEMSGSRPDADAVTASTGTARRRRGRSPRGMRRRAPRPRRAGRGWSGRGSSPSWPSRRSRAPAADGRGWKYFGAAKVWPISSLPTTTPSTLDQRAVGLVVEGDLPDRR